jgi:hypothetical protein
MRAQVFREGSKPTHGHGGKKYGLGCKCCSRPDDATSKRLTHRDIRRKAKVALREALPVLQGEVMSRRVVAIHFVKAEKKYYWRVIGRPRVMYETKKAAEKAAAKGDRG